MSNDKQSMKLYTEEQLINTVEAIRDYLKNYPEKFHESMIKKHLMNLAPIELPSDEEIREWAEMQSLGEPTGAEEFGRIYGAKWMRDLVQGGSK